MARDWSEFETTKQVSQPKDWSQYESTPVAKKEGPDTWQKLAGLGQGFKHSVEDVVHGITGPVIKSGIFGESMKNSFDPYRQGTLEDYEKAREAAPLQAAIGRGAGAIGIRAPVAAALAPFLGTSFLGNVANAGLTGAAAGYAKHAEPGESRGWNSVTEGATDAGLTALTGGLYHLGKAAPNFVKNVKELGPKNALKGLLKSEEAALAPAKAVYGEIESTLKNAGKTSNIPKPNINWDELEKVASKDQIREARQLLEEGTYEAFNKAQSKLSDIARGLGKEVKAGAGIDTKLAKEAVEEAEKRIHGKLFQRFEEVAPELANKYQKANELYAAAKQSFDFKPLNEYKDIVAKYGSADSKAAKKTLRDLLENPEFRLGVGQTNKQIGRANTLANVLSVGKKGAVAGAAGKLAWDQFKGK